MKLIVTIADLDEARSQERSLIFLWVNWAIHAPYSEIEVRKLLETWQGDYPEWKAAAYRADVSEQKGDIWDALVEWLQDGEEPRLDLMWAGAGALLWLRSGSIVASVKYAVHVGYDKLLGITRDSFGGQT